MPLRRQELIEVQPSMRLMVTAALPRKKCERATSVIKAGVRKALGKQCLCADPELEGMALTCANTVTYYYLDYYHIQCGSSFIISKTCECDSDLL